MNKCNHHWHIESPDGPESKGTCKLCGATRAFLNSDPALQTSKKARAYGLEPSSHTSSETGGRQKHLGFYVPSMMDFDRSH